MYIYIYIYIFAYVFAHPANSQVGSARGFLVRSGEVGARELASAPRNDHIIRVYTYIRIVCVCIYIYIYICMYVCIDVCM